MRRKYIDFNCIVLISVTLLYTFNNSFVKPSAHGLLGRLFNNYFNDIICPWALLSLTNLFFIFYIPLCKGIIKFKIPFLDVIKYGIYQLKTILIYCFICAVYWEFIYPLNHIESTSDIYDLACYMVGGVLFHLIYRLFKNYNTYSDL